ncbi:b340068e-b848-4142-80f0-4e99cb364fd3 [Sclerotinia trifoliorum]|uniref:B340068e-b848-4142-80f0-4e99cb364fd3 n=1 Tax=Sclerotinia trifoliorum TaxID=28548 RepID=A0A8H2VSW1_9HELO|nr:b340068e-b848-4142-80f0-4e99cb364fd3 [Sclerotinia trifoliorum]
MGSKFVYRFETVKIGRNMHLLANSTTINTVQVRYNSVFLKAILSFKGHNVKKTASLYIPRGKPNTLRSDSTVAEQIPNLKE